MNPRVVAVFAQTLGHICDGQLREIFTSGRVDQSREEYELRIYGKTASLFAGAAEMGALLGHADEAQVENLRAFGGEVGMAFQIIDDVLDLRSSTDELGKPVGSDLRQGTLTLPTMLYLEHADGAAPAHTVRRIFDGDEVSDAEFAQVATAIQESGALDASIASAHDYVARAKARLADLADPETACYLAAFADYALERVS
jgi:geranylgeranyl pyrophosphate synthase